VTLQEALRLYLPPVEQALQQILTPPTEDFKPFYQMMQYHHGWLDERFRPTGQQGGKRIRPLLCLLCCGAAFGQPHELTPLAAAIELLHSFSLVHDDIQDRSPTRRHRPAVWALWGEAQAINVGDALYAAAQWSLSALAGSLEPTRVCALRSQFDETCLRLCEGQYLDLEFSSRPTVSREQYLLMIERKTAWLLGYCAWAGSFAAGVSESVAARYREFGLCLGLAFQVLDDVLGVWGAEDETGKPSSSDIVEAKKTLPYIEALAMLPADLAQELQAIYRGPESTREEAAVARARELMEQAGARRACLKLAAHYHERAVQILKELNPEPEHAEALLELVSLLSTRRS
jgi:geranylgeranyl diphosphate synthase type I